MSSLIPRPSFLMLHAKKREFACNIKKLGERSWGWGYYMGMYQLYSINYCSLYLFYTWLYALSKFNLQDGFLYSGPGAKFFCISDYSFDFISENKVPPPSLDRTDWIHIFIQSHSDRRELLPGTKFLYLEYQTPYMRNDAEDNFRYTWSSS